jgi:Zn-dependent peptidase ImmA (M78 family)
LFGNIDTDTSINGGFYISDKNLKNMEIQANKFAANLLMPEGVV